MVVVARVLAVHPADEPDVEVGIPVELLVEARVGVVPHVRSPEMLVRDELGGEVGHAGRSRSVSARNAFAQPDRKLRHVSESAHVSSRVGRVGLEYVHHSIAETADGIQCRLRIDHRRVAAVDELPDAEGLEAQLDRPAPVRRDVEEGVRVECRAHVDASAREPLELERPAAPEHREQHAERGPARAPEGEPGQIRLLHARRIPHDPLPPGRSSVAVCAARVGVHEEAEPGIRDRVEDGADASKSANTAEPTRRRRNRRARPGENARKRPPLRPTSWTPSTQALLQPSASAAGSPPRPRLGWSDSTATSMPCRSSARSRGSSLVISGARSGSGPRPSRARRRRGTARPFGREALRRRLRATGAGGGRTSSCGRVQRSNIDGERLERQRHLLVRMSRGTRSRTKPCARRGPCSEASTAAEVDRLRGDRQLDGRRPELRGRASPRSPPRAERASAVRSSTPAPASSTRARTTRAVPGGVLGRDRLRRDAQLGKAVLPRAFARATSPSSAR